MPKIMYFFESRLQPGKWCETSEEGVTRWADDGYKVKKVVYPDVALPSKPKILPINESPSYLETAKRVGSIIASRLLGYTPKE
jgi:hypothetical protein